ETYLKWVVDNASTNATPNESATSVPTPTQSAVRPSMPVATPTLSTSGSDLLTKGKLIFEKTAGGVGCAHCHGLDGKGRGPAGIQAANIRSKNEGDIRAAIQGGVPMMSFIKLSDDEITAVAAYLQHLATQPERTR
ncbi:MAG: cytochrome c, partial [Chloroflexi bacterium]|nr:cytochrome c [Chloroflexota bacterium]